VFEHVKYGLQDISEHEFNGTKVCMKFKETYNFHMLFFDFSNLQIAEKLLMKCACF